MVFPPRLRTQQAMLSRLIPTVKQRRSAIPTVMAQLRNSSSISQQVQKMLLLLTMKTVTLKSYARLSMLPFLIRTVTKQANTPTKLSAL